MTTLERELATYQRNLSSLLVKEGKFVLIHGEDVVDSFDTYDDALKFGYVQFKLEPFLVKQISSMEQSANFTRRFSVPCRA